MSFDLFYSINPFFFYFFATLPLQLISNADKILNFLRLKVKKNYLIKHQTMLRKRLNTYI